MKKILFVCAIAIASLISTKAMSQMKPGSPSEVAVGLMKSLINLNFSNAEKFVRSEDSSKLAMAEGMMSQQMSSLPDSVKQLLSSIKCTASNEKISGDSATVDVTMASDKAVDPQGDKEKKRTIHLVKESGVWKAILDMKGDDDGDE